MFCWHLASLRLTPVELLNSLKNDLVFDGQQEMCPGPSNLVKRKPNPTRSNQAKVTSATELICQDNLTAYGPVLKVNFYLLADGMGISTVTAARHNWRSIERWVGRQRKFCLLIQCVLQGLSKTYTWRHKHMIQLAPWAQWWAVWRQILAVSRCKWRRWTRRFTALLSAMKMITALNLSRNCREIQQAVHFQPQRNHSCHTSSQHMLKSADRATGRYAICPAAATYCRLCSRIADQLIKLWSNLKLESAVSTSMVSRVVMVVGRRSFLPKDCCYHSKNRRKWAQLSDRHRWSWFKRAEWKAKYTTVDTVMDLQTWFWCCWLQQTRSKLLCLFNESHMQYEPIVATMLLVSHPIAQMTEKSIDILGQQQQRFFPHVEAGRIDHGHHQAAHIMRYTDSQ